jgi:hypothetical protein
VFRDEAVAFAIWAGGEAELHVRGGAFPGFYDIGPGSAAAWANDFLS